MKEEDDEIGEIEVVLFSCSSSMENEEDRNRNLRCKN